MNRTIANDKFELSLVKTNYQYIILHFVIKGKKNVDFNITYYTTENPYLVLPKLAQRIFDEWPDYLELTRGKIPKGYQGLTERDLIYIDKSSNEEMVPISTENNHHVANNKNNVQIPIVKKDDNVEMLALSSSWYPTNKIKFNALNDGTKYDSTSYTTPIALYSVQLTGATLLSSPTIRRTERVYNLEFKSNKTAPMVSINGVDFVPAIKDGENWKYEFKNLIITEDLKIKVM